jgi:hypothetical protein
MPDDAKTTRRREAAEPGQVWDATCAAMLENNQQTLARVMQDAQAISSEVWELAQARMRLAMETWSEIAACRNPEQFVDCQKRLLARAAEHFAGEMTKLSELMLKIGFVRPSG